VAWQSSNVAWRRSWRRGVWHQRSKMANIGNGYIKISDNRKRNRGIGNGGVGVMMAAASKKMAARISSGSGTLACRRAFARHKSARKARKIKRKKEEKRHRNKLKLDTSISMK
jgi:hypothetical protein